MKTYKQILILIFASLLLSACGAGVGDYDPGSSTGDDTTAPQITGVDPLDGDTVEAICAITATFDEPIDAASVDDTSFQIVHSVAGTLGATDGTWGLSESSTAQIIFVPTAAPASGTISVTATTSITDEDGNSLATNSSWSFTTDGLPCPP